MFDRLRLAAARAALRVAAPATGWKPIGDHEPGDVFVVGFPKSGHTWVQYLLAGVLGLDASRVSDALVNDLIPDVHARLGYRRYSTPVFFKSHALPAPSYRRVVYLLRDGRDAMVSWFHHHNALFPPVAFPTLVRRAPHLEARWHEHVEAWTANPHGAELLVLRYEEMRREPVRELGRLMAFAGLEVAPEVLAAAVANASFERQKQREAKLGWETKEWPKDRPFVRRGAVGSFRDEMPPEALALFLAEAGATLQKFGYPT